MLGIGVLAGYLLREARRWYRYSTNNTQSSSKKCVAERETSCYRSIPEMRRKVGLRKIGSAICASVSKVKDPFFFPADGISEKEVFLSVVYGSFLFLALYVAAVCRSIIWLNLMIIVPLALIIQPIAFFVRSLRTAPSNWGFVTPVLVIPCSLVSIIGAVWVAVAAAWLFCPAPLFLVHVV